MLVTIGSAGDLFPFLCLGQALRARGDQVTLAAPALQEPYARAAGLAFHGLPADPGVLADTDLWDARKGFGVVWRATRPAMRELGRFLAALPQHQPLLLLAHPLALAEADLCRAARPDVQVVAAYLAPSNLRTEYGPLSMGPLALPAWAPRLLRRLLWSQVEKHIVHPAALGDINRARAVRGLHPVTSVLRYLHGVADVSVTLFPPWFGPAQPDWPVPLVEGDFPLYDPNPDVLLAPQLQAWLAAGDAPLAATHGTGNTQAEAFFRTVLGAAATLGRRVLLLTPERGQLPAALPPHALWQAYVPLRALLPRVAALIHHGGIGTTAEALRAGTPQLVVPLAFDQFDNAARVTRCHAGLGIAHARLTHAGLAGTLTTLLSSRTIEAGCQAARNRFHAPSGLDRVLESIQALVSDSGQQ